MVSVNSVCGEFLHFFVCVFPTGGMCDAVKMGKNESGLCKEEVEDGMCCERCVNGITKSVSPHNSGDPDCPLGNTLLVFLCSVCLETRNERKTGGKRGRGR